MPLRKYHAPFIGMIGIVFLFLFQIPSYSQSLNYYYDDSNQLIRIDYGDTVVDYTYDELGNRVTETISHPPITSASPQGGVYTSSQSVTLTCTDPQGPGCDKIYYTTDGTTPTTSSPVYSSPISISATTTLKYFAKDLAGISETVKSQTYTVDIGPPTGTIVINSGDSSTTSPNVTLTLTCTDDVACSQMKFSNDNITYSSPETYGGTKAWTLTAWDGTKSVFVKFMDTAGQWSGTYSDTIILNNNPPNPPIKIGGTGYTGLQEAYNAASDGATIKCQAVRLLESLTVNRNISVTLDGGYDSGFTSNSGGQTNIKGIFTTTTGGGTITIGNFVLEQ
jgi:YD repeat-containing protein